MEELHPATVQAISEFDAAVKRFHEAYLALGHSIGQVPSVGPRWVYYCGAAACDVLGFCFLFKKIYLESVRHMCVELQEMIASMPPGQILEEQSVLISSGFPLSESAQRRLLEIAEEYPPRFPSRFVDPAARARHFEEYMGFGTAFKAGFYFIRAYQDAVYKLMLAASGRPVGKSSMKAALKAGNPVGDLLRTRYPAYLPWFEDWRAKRNSLKVGRAHAIAGPDENPGITFVTFDEETHGICVDCSDSATLRISFVIEALEQSTSVSELCLDQVRI